MQRARKKAKVESDDEDEGEEGEELEDGVEEEEDDTDKLPLGIASKLPSDAELEQDTLAILKSVNVVDFSLKQLLEQLGMPLPPCITCKSSGGCSGGVYGGCGHSSIAGCICEHPWRGCYWPTACSEDASLPTSGMLMLMGCGENTCMQPLSGNQAAPLRRSATSFTVAQQCVHPASGDKHGVDFNKLKQKKQLIKRAALMYVSAQSKAQETDEDEAEDNDAEPGDLPHGMAHLLCSRGFCLGRGYLTLRHKLQLFSSASGFDGVADSQQLCMVGWRGTGASLLQAP